MKQRFYRLVLFLALAITSCQLWAQSADSQNSSSSTTTTSTTNVKVSSGGGDWYTQPWVWIVGAAVFVLLLVALLSSGRRDTVRSERVTVKRREGDV